MEIRFVPVDETNIDCVARLRVAAGQEHTVETVAQSWEEAKQFDLWRPVAIVADGNMVGFAMYGCWKDEGEAGRVWLDRFLIDVNYQGRGYARPVLTHLLVRMQKEYGCDTIYLSVYADNRVAIRLYESFGFKFNGERDINGELVMVLDIQK